MDLGQIVLPLVVFLAELLVVTISTIRIIFVSRGMRILAPLLGFFEITIWLYAITRIMQNLNTSICLAFAAGFTLGNYLGILIEEKLAMGTALVRLITGKDPGELVGKLARADFGVTCMEGQGATGRVQVILTVVKRKEVERVVSLIKQFDPKIFYSIDEVQTVNEGVFPLPRQRPGVVPNPFKILRVG
jgi:uncharacterized protein YebE (UPF0316 family)